MCNCFGRSDNLPRLKHHTEGAKFTEVFCNGLRGVVGSENHLKAALANAMKNAWKVTKGNVVLPEHAVHIQDQAADGRGESIKHILLQPYLNFSMRYSSTAPSIQPASGLARSSKFSLPMKTRKVSRVVSSYTPLVGA